MEFHWLFWERKTRLIEDKFKIECKVENRS